MLPSIFLTVRCGPVVLSSFVPGSITGGSGSRSIIIQQGQNCKCNFAPAGDLIRDSSRGLTELVHNVIVDLGGLDVQGAGELVVEQPLGFPQNGLV